MKLDPSGNERFLELPTPHKPETGDPNLDELPEMPKRLGRRWHVRDYQRGFGSFLHEKCRGRTYEAWAVEVLTEVCRKWGNGMFLDLSKRNPMCRFIVTRYTWSPLDNERYDRNGEPPRRTFNVHKRTPVVPVAFLPVSWEVGSIPGGTRAGEFNEKLQADRVPSMAIYDMYESTGLRRPHARYIIPDDTLPALRGRKLMRLAHGIWHEYRVDEENLLEVLTEVLDGHLRTPLGMNRENLNLSFFLEDALAAGLDGWESTTSDVNE
ncbi:MAG: hypothetical protein Q9170_002527 [Blastenia crenularia]